MSDELKVTHHGKPLSAETATKVHEALKKTLQEELAKEHKTVGGGAAAPAWSVSGHGSGIERAEK
jgi:hypothetical protein